MTTPPFLLGAALLFWGFETGLPWAGLAAAVAIELPGFLKARWHFSQADLDRIWNLCVALFLGATVYAFVASENLSTVGELIKENSASSRLAALNQSKRSLFELLQWLPLMFLPIVLAQVYGEQPRMKLSTFSWWLRRKRSQPGYAVRYQALELSVTYPFFACCLFSASTGNQRTWWFAAGLVALVVWPLWLTRSRSFTRTRWVSSLALALALGFGLQFGMLQLQRLVQRLDEALLAEWGRRRQSEADETQTRIGAIGRLKLSGRIVLRVTPREPEPPELLQVATYNLFRTPIWTCPQHHFEHVTPETNLTTWILRPVRPPSRSTTIAGYLPGGSGLLALPHGVARLDHLAAFNLVTNRFGCVRVEEGPGLVEVQATSAPGPSIDSPPLPRDDLEVPRQEQPALRRVASALRLNRFADDRAGREALVQTVEDFFAKNFTYSTWQDSSHRALDRRTALARFLLENHAGHCEYFATATVLLLRAAGIPARYATGFYVHEKSGGSYLVRERDAHAWCLAWIGGAWRNIDTTPADWLAVEGRHASSLQPFWDFWSGLWFEFSKWRWEHTDWKKYLLWAIIPLLAFVAGKLILEKQWSRSRHQTAGDQMARKQPGLDSEFYSIERRLNQAGFTREPGEPAGAWLLRLQKAGVDQVSGLHTLLHLHYRLRFDPPGLTAAEREVFRSQVQAWLEGQAKRIENSHLGSCDRPPANDRSSVADR